MLKSGEMKMPMGRIPAFAAASNADPAEPIKTAMAEYHPGTRSEAGIVMAIRAMGKGHPLDFRPES